MTKNDKIEDPRDRDPLRDPVTGKKESHPLGTGAGTVVGAVAGGALGALGGPAGLAAGTVAGGVIGGAAGRALADRMDPAAEETYWRENFTGEPYYRQGRRYEDYAPAYRTGIEGWRSYRGKPFDEIEPELQRSYTAGTGEATMAWEEAKAAARAAWDRLERALPGDADRDGR